MNPKGTDGFPDTIVLSDTARIDLGRLNRGKVAPERGKELPPELPKDALRVPQAVMQEIERLSRTMGRELSFEVDLDGSQAVIHVLDRATGEEIRQIPREDLQPIVQAKGPFELRLFDQWV